jgi:ornithine cyclodeaminase/alanine dehydrogenase-like protein (mu-crystallin family)
MRVRLLTASDVARLVGEVGLGEFVDGLISSLEGLLRRWRELRVVPRTSFQYPGGVMEAMPAGDERWFAVKVVNGHPGNPLRGLSTVVALGILAEAETGYPLLVADATLLTAFRTGAASAVATKYLARRGSKTLGIVGTGAQSEFLCFSVSRVVPVEKVVFYDVDPRAMAKFEANMRLLGFELEAAGSAREVAERSGVVITATAAGARAAHWSSAVTASSRCSASGRTSSPLASTPPRARRASASSSARTASLCEKPLARR